MMCHLYFSRYKLFNYKYVQIVLHLNKDFLFFVLFSSGALPGPYEPVLVTCGALVTHRYTYELPRNRTSQYCRTFLAVSVSPSNGLVDPVFDGVGLACFKSRTTAYLSHPFCLLLFSVYLLSCYGLVLWDWVFGLIGC